MKILLILIFLSLAVLAGCTQNTNNNQTNDVNGEFRNINFNSLTDSQIIDLAKAGFDKSILDYTKGDHIGLVILVKEEIEDFEELQAVIISGDPDNCPKLGSVNKYTEQTCYLLFSVIKSDKNICNKIDPAYNTGLTNMTMKQECETFDLQKSLSNTRHPLIACGAGGNINASRNWCTYILALGMQDKKICDRIENYDYHETESTTTPKENIYLKSKCTNEINR
ncbi:MAG: hypothetical protein Q7R70_03530 [Candidatus Diapherotrites archaeon]|nr:hypothetical protein [Candidatus Diapherotrites archaeon]